MPLLALEFCSRGELFDLVSRAGYFSENTARFYFSQITETVDYLHQNGVAHRDIKAENLLLDDNLDIKFIDFAFACDARVSLVGAKGTPGYLAPETQKKEAICPQALDIFAMGVVLFIMVRGLPPF